MWLNLNKLYQGASRGRKAQHSRLPRPFRPQLEALEDRLTPTSSSLSGGLLTVTGTSGQDTITITRSGSHILGYLAEHIQAIEIFGQGDSDTINIESIGKDISVTVYGGTEVDHINLSPTAHNLAGVFPARITVYGDGEDELTLFDQQSTTNHDYTISDERVRLGDGTNISFFDLGSLNLKGTHDLAAPSTITIENTAFPIAIDAGARATVNVPNADPRIVDSFHDRWSLTVTGEMISNNGTSITWGTEINLHSNPGSSYGFYRPEGSLQDHIYLGSSVNNPFSDLYYSHIRAIAISNDAAPGTPGRNGDFYFGHGGLDSYTQFTLNGDGDSTLSMDESSFAAHTWHISGKDAHGNDIASQGAGNVDGRIFFTGMGELMGELGPDRFVFSPGKSIRAVSGGSWLTPACMNTLDYSAYTTGVTVNLELRQATGVTGTWYAVGGIEIVIGGAGNDTLIGNSSRNILRGRGGSDTLLGGDGNDILVGDDRGQKGSDRLYGGDGRDLVIGGAGADLVSGGSGDDIVIAGSTSFDNSDAILRTFQAVWQRTDLSYTARVQRLRTGVGPLGTYRLNSSSVFADLANDTLAGNQDSDWFFSSTGDKLSDRYIKTAASTAPTEAWN